MLNGSLILLGSLGALLVIHDCIAVNQCACPTLNPAVRCFAPGVIKCNSSATCSKGNVCCVDNCGGTDCVPLPADQSCPVLPKGTIGICLEGCVNGCPTGMKCCSNGCGHVCKCPNVTYTAAEYVAQRVHPGECPYVNLAAISCFAPSTLVNHCTQDGECNDTQKCCTTPCDGLQCTSPAPVTASKEKRGECPFFDRRFVKCMTTPGNCSSDADCVADFKCCQPLCGGKTCMAAAPVIVKPGCCPTQPSPCTSSSGSSDPEQPPSYWPDQCSNDGTCPNDQKCCIVPGTGNQCMSPDDSSTVKVKKGDCPVPDRTVEKCRHANTYTNECSEDGCCDGEKKCCTSACGANICLSPAPVTIKSGNCPKTNSTRLGYKCAKLTAADLANACTSDGTCPRKQKCCIVMCKGFQCTDPAL